MDYSGEVWREAPPTVEEEDEEEEQEGSGLDLCFWTCVALTGVENDH